MKIDKVLKAYSDACNIDYERNIDFKDDRKLTALQWFKLMSKATPFGYNDFDVEVTYKVFKMLDKNIKYIIAREGSVCIYLTNFRNKEQQNKTFQKLVNINNNNLFNIYIDEIHIENDEIRLWFD